MTKDGDLRSIFRSRMPDIHWQPIESPVTASGIPDVNGCHEDTGEFWIEYKRCSANAVGIDKFQVAWHERRCRSGGRTFLAVRLIATEGPRRETRDELWVFHGTAIRRVFLGGLRGAHALYRGVGGPARWDWAAVRQILRSMR